AGQKLFFHEVQGCGKSATNAVERLIEEIRRRERVIRIFPNRESAIRLIGALLMEIDDKWISGKKYLDMSEYLQWQEEQKQINDQSNIAYIR
ncbi:MAG TPA: transposase, partial [Limnochordia bacterium]|nr:transposase [Limnochordia bacterium]